MAMQCRIGEKHPFHMPVRKECKNFYQPSVGDQQELYYQQGGRMVRQAQVDCRQLGWLNLDASMVPYLSFRRRAKAMASLLESILSLPEYYKHIRL